MVISEIQSHLKAIGEDITLYQETSFNNRADALDFIDFHILDRIDGLLPNGKQGKELNTLKQRAAKLKSDLEKIDTNLFTHLREKIRTGAYTPTSFKEM